MNPAAPAPHQGARHARLGGRAEPGAWPSLRSGHRRWFVLALVVALLAHLPALPFDPLFLARVLLHSAPPQAADEPESREVIIPIDLDLEDRAPSAEPATAEQPQAAPGPGTGEGTPSAPSAGPPSAQETPAPPAASKKPDDTYDEFEKPKRGTATLKDPIAVAGGPGKLGPKDPFVQVLFNGNRLRGNNAGSALGGVLTALPEWKSFFEGTKIDPVTDAEHLLIAGPQLRKSKDVVVWMQYRVSEADMKAAIDALVKRTKGGKWLEDAPVPAAIATAHQYKRIFALVPGKKLLVILPLSAKDQLAKVKGVRPFNGTSKAGIVISLVTPRNAFTDYLDVVDVPATFKSLRMVVTPLAGGGADVALEIADASAEAATRDAPGLEEQLAHMRTLAKIATLIGADVLPAMPVQIDGDILRVNVTVSQKGLNHILNLARTHFAKRAAEDAKQKKDVKDEGEPTEKKKGGDQPSSSSQPVSPSPSGAPAPSTSPSPGSSAAPVAPPVKLPPPDGPAPTSSATTLDKK